MTGTPNKVKKQPDYNPPMDALDVLHYDDDLLVVNKPSGLLSVAGRAAHLSDCLEARAQAAFCDARIVHRLDMDTSGVMVMARNAPAHKHLGQQFEHRKTRKIYIARVWGIIEDDTGCVDLPLRCDWPNRPLQMVDHAQGKSAQTHWEVLTRADNVTRVKLTPITGRSHQLRVHMLEIGHSILGDDLYAHEDAFHAAERLQLHAETLEFVHPSSGASMTFTASCPF